MSNEIRFAAQSGKTLYFILMSGSSVLDRTVPELTTYVSADYADYVIAATEVGSSGIYQGSMPPGSPVGDYDVFPYEAVDGLGNEAEGDPFAAGAFSIYWSGTTVSTSPGANVDADVALVTLAECKQYLNITNTTDNVIIAQLINAVSSWVKNYLGRDLVQSTHTEYYSGDGSCDLALRNRPIVSVTSVYIDSLRTWAASSLITSANYILKKANGMLQAFYLLGGWTCGTSNIKVVYVAGYTAGTDVPYDIRLAVNRIIDHQFRVGYTHRKLDFSSESISGMNITFKDSDIPKDVKLMLDPYRDFFPSPQFDYAD